MTLNPGIYNGRDQLERFLVRHPQPGIYYINGGGINMSGSSSITGNGVLIYNTGGGTINLSGTGTISLSPMTTGAYAGITLFQDRADSAAATMSGASNVKQLRHVLLPGCRAHSERRQRCRPGWLSVYRQVVSRSREPGVLA